MKIGILTYHRTLNYGACLQAVATRIVLERMGHEAYYVDYWPKYHSRSYKAFSMEKLFANNFRMAIHYLRDSIQYYKFRKQRIENFETFFQQYIYPYCKPLSEEYDVIIYGSDQIWRKQSALKEYNPIYFGVNDFKAKKHITYSASMGNLPKSKEDIDKVKELFSHIDKIAVREQDLKALLESMGYKDVTLTLDPTLLLSSQEWDAIIPTNEEYCEKYVLVYGIDKVSFDMKEIYAFAKKKGCSVKILSGTATVQDTEDHITTASPAKFISLIKNADYVFTSSFHGLAFSVIYGKEFYASYRKNSNRAQTLLDALEIRGRITTGSIIPEDSCRIDYCKVETLLDKNRLSSKEYLLESIHL